MKRTINYVIGMSMSVLAFGASAQTMLSKSKASDHRVHRTIADSTVSQRMNRDLNGRNSTTINQEVNWRSSGYGYYGTYSTDSVEYMARYDKEGNYVETLSKKEWNTAPADLKSSYERSSYKLQKVKGYWVVTDPGRKGYYLN